MKNLQNLLNCLEILAESSLSSLAQVQKRNQDLERMAQTIEQELSVAYRCENIVSSPSANLVRQLWVKQSISKKHSIERSVKEGIALEAQMKVQVLEAIANKNTMDLEFDVQRRGIMGKKLKIEIEYLNTLSILYSRR